MLASECAQLSGLLAALACVGPITSRVGAQDGPAGITEPTVFGPFNPEAPPCHSPPGLKKVLAFAQDNEREFMKGVGYGLATAAKDRGLEYRVALANNDAAKMIGQVQAFRAEKIGGLVAAPIDPASLSRSLSGFSGMVATSGSVVPPPATSLLNAPQYLTGKVLGDAAAAYIRDNLDGKADVVLLTHDSLQFLAPRFVAMRDALRDMPGVNIIADISPTTVNKEGGYATMSFILLAHPDVDVVLGADTVVLGALAALRAAGKDRPNQFLAGIDGEPEAISEIKRGGGPYKMTVSLAYSHLWLRVGRARSRLAGERSPAMDILPTLITKDNISRYEADLADPAGVYSNPARRGHYPRMYGNICYDSRDGSI